MKRLSVSWTRSGDASNAALNAGSAGRLMSMASAVSAVIAPRSTTRARESERIMARPATRRSGILEAEDAAVDVVGEQLGVAAPVDHGLEDLARFALGQIVLELGEEAAFGRAVTRTFVEDPTDVRGQGHGTPQMVGEDLLAVMEVGGGKRLAGRQDLDVAAAHLGEAQKLERLD